MIQHLVGNNRNDYVCKFKESQSAVNITIPKPSLFYLNYFIGLKCVPELLATGFYPNVKEITESVGAYRAIRKNLCIDPKRDDVIVYVIGDGKKPRTGALIAYLTKWTIVSIDPTVKADVSSIDRLIVVKSKIENCRITLPDKYYNIAIGVFVHSHASIQSFIDILTLHTTQRLYIVSIPCCVPDDIKDPLMSYMDTRIIAPQRQVSIYAPGRNT